MHGKYLPRQLERSLQEHLETFPAVAVLGPRQCGKSTLAKHYLGKRGAGLYLDLERPSDSKKLGEPELFFDLHRDELICLDEIQRTPELFPILRGVIDEKNRPGQFLILGSASPRLIRQSSESLAGRISYLELTPFLQSEIGNASPAGFSYWLRGGFPESFLARSGRDSLRWRQNFIRTFLERDIPQLGFKMPARTLERFWTMCAHHHGQLLNQSTLGSALGVSHTTIRSYLELLEETYLIRLLPPFLPNLKKRLVRSPKLYLRDSGLLHALLGLETSDELLGHPIGGHSWEGLVIENVLRTFPDWRGFFYRTANGAEIDLVLEKGSRQIAVECKLSSAPELSRGFWTALEDLNIKEAWVIAPVKDSYPIKKGITVAPLLDGLRSMAQLT